MTKSYKYMTNTNFHIYGCHLTVFIVDLAFSHHFVLPYYPSYSTPIGVLVVLATPVKKISKLAGNLTGLAGEKMRNH